MIGARIGEESLCGTTMLPQNCVAFRVAVRVSEISFIELSPGEQLT